MKASYYLKLVLSLSLFITPFFAHAGTADNIAGWAWSSNIGWISFNCTNVPNSCNVDYGVNKNSDGTLTGYAWSSNIGWIKFGGFGTGFPSGSGTQAVDATMNGNNLKGWARAVNHDNSWDGWISLSGAGYGVSLSNAKFTGSAWGSDVVGWINFDAADYSGAPASCNGSCVVTFTDNTSIDARLSNSSVAGSSVPSGSNVSLVWTITNLANGASCIVSKTSGPTAFSDVSTTSSGSISTGALAQGSYTYRIQCSHGASILSTNNVSFTVDAQQAGFVITGPSSLTTQFLNQNGADSQVGTYFVDNGGTSFASPVTVSVQSMVPSLPNGVTATYLFNNIAQNSVLVPTPGTGFTFKVRFNKNPGTSHSYTVTLFGTDGGGVPITSTKAIEVIPTGFNPAFQEF